MIGESLSEQARTIVKHFYAGGARGKITSFRDSLAEDFVLFVPPQLPKPSMSRCCRASRPFLTSHE